MENLNVLKRSLTERAVSFAVASSVADDSIDVTGCGGLAFQLVISASSGLSAATVTLQKSLDNSNWVNDGTATSITGNGALSLIEAMQPLGGNFYRLAYALSAGLFTVNGDVLGKTFGGSSGATTGGGGGGSGTVTSVGLSVPSALLTVSGSPVTTSGTLAVTLPTRAANIVFAGPTTGSAATPAFRALVAADIPNISTDKLTTGTLPVARGGTNSTTALNNNRVIQSSGGAVVEAAAITASKALVSDANGIPVASATTATELGYVSGVTSAIQTQLDAKEPAITTLSIAKGGTNSGTSLNNNRILTSQSGAIKEASAITASKILVSDANGIPVASSQASSELGTYVVGPGTVTANRIMVFNSTTGYLAKQTGVSIGGTTSDPTIVTPGTIEFVVAGSVAAAFFNSAGSLIMEVSGQVIGPINGSTNIDLGTSAARMRDIYLKGGAFITAGANQSCGTATLVGGTVTVSNTRVTASSLIFAMCNAPGGIQGILSVDSSKIVASTSFVIDSSNVGDTSTVRWLFIN